MPHFRFWAGLLGGLLLVIFGISALLTRPSPGLELTKYQALNQSRNYFLRGFFLNTINPFTLFCWLSIGSGIVATNRGNGNIKWALLICTLLICTLLYGKSAK